MGPLFVILFWLLLAVGAATLWVPCVLWLIRARRRKNRGEAILASIPALGIPSMGVLLIAVVVVFTASGFIPRVAFKREFGFAPPDDVTNLRGSTFGPFDERTTILSFRAGRLTIERLAKDLEPCEESQSCGDRPVLWEPGTDVVCFHASDLESTTLIWDPRTQDACYDSWRLQ